jgi:3-oxoacid CoA-transferase subunit A
MIYITGDCHGIFSKIYSFCEENKTSLDDILVILGDVGINYSGDASEKRNKKRLSKLPITLFLLHGNHENRPQNIPTYIEKEWNGGTVLFEEKYPNLLFPKDGDIFNLLGFKTLVLGGAYSIDKYFRLRKGYSWWDDEQPDDKIKEYAEKNIEKHGNTVDFVFSHTCPYKYMPTEAFLPIDQAFVDNSTELWLDSIENKLTYKEWFCGHFHINKRIDNLTFLLNGFVSIEPVPDSK